MLYFGLFSRLATIQATSTKCRKPLELQGLQGFHNYAEKQHYGNSWKDHMFTHRRELAEANRPRSYLSKYPK